MIVILAEYRRGTCSWKIVHYSESEESDGSKIHAGEKRVCILARGNR
jgi:hypothetical protein